MASRIIFTFIFINFILGCEKEPSNREIVFYQEEDKFTSLSDMVEDYKIILLSNEEDYLTNRIVKIQYLDQKLFVLDRQNLSGRILIFNEDGKALTKVDAQGKGPNEYLQIADFDINAQKKELLVADPGNRKVLKFSSTGRFINSRVVNHWIKNINSLEVNNANSIIITSTLGSHTTESGDNYDLFFFDEEMNLKSKKLPFEKPNDTGMGNGFNFYETDRAVNYYRTFTDSIYQIDRNGKLELETTVSFPADILPTDKVMDHMMGNIPLRDYVYFVSYFENDKAIVFTYSWNGNDYIGVYKKSTKNANVAQVPKLPSCGECFSLNMVGAFDEFFISYSETGIIDDFLDIIDPLRKKCTNPQVLSGLDSSNKNGNSIVLLLKFK